MKEQPPVLLPDGSAYLPDGTHIPQAAIDRAVEVIARACELIEALPAEVRAALQKEARR